MKNSNGASVAISSGHGLYVSGANNLVNEVVEARKMTDRLESLLNDAMKVFKFHDNSSRTQSENLKTIVGWHNTTGANYHYSIHLNSSVGTYDRDIGVEVLYRYDSDKVHAAALAKAISDATGLINRGAKQRVNLAFLAAPKRLLIELYFVNSRADVNKMDEEHELNACALAIAKTMCAQQGVTYVQTDNKPHRIKTGTYKTYEQAEDAKQKMGQFGLSSVLWSKVIPVGEYWVVQTGVYESKGNAELAVKRMQERGILKIAHVIAV